jgi:hypothetical protein
MSPAGPEDRGGGSPPIERRSGRDSRYAVRLIVDGRELALKPFVQDMLGGAVVGLVSGLKDGEDAGEVSLEVRRP